MGTLSFLFIYVGQMNLGHSNGKVVEMINVLLIRNMKIIIT